MLKSSSVSPDIRREWSAAGQRWRGWVEHVQSGEDAAFLDLDDMLRFIRQCGALADDEAGFREILRGGLAKGDGK
jgi:hypothetical protein